jgi:hypothetical protein
LNSVRHFTGGVDVQLKNGYGAFVEADGNGCRGSSEKCHQIHKFVVKQVFACGNGDTCIVVGDGIGIIDLVEEKIQGSHSIFVFQGQVGILCG